MTCDDYTACIRVRVAFDDRLLDYDYYKISCGREINADGRLKSLALGKTLAEIAGMTADDLAAALSVENDDDRFLLFLELDALQNAIAQYLGREKTSAGGRCRVAAISCESDHIEIRENIMPVTRSASPGEKSARSLGADCEHCGM